MDSLFVEGGIPLNGEIVPSGSASLASKLIIFSLFGTEEVILSNVPNVPHVNEIIQLVRTLGTKVEWIDKNKLSIDSSGVSTSRVPYDEGSKYLETLLLVSPLVFRFGKAIVPRPADISLDFLKNCTDVWRDLGFEVDENQEWIKIEAGVQDQAGVSFKYIDPFLTTIAIASSIFFPGKTIIGNAAEESEVDRIIEFLNLLGSSVKRVEPRRIEVFGENIFKGGSLKVAVDVNEIVYFSVAALLTGGTVSIKNVNKVALAPFVNILNKLETNFEFMDDTLTVWHGGEEYEPVEVSAKPAPGFLNTWVPTLILLLTQAHGESIVEAALIEKDWSFVSDFNRMGAEITYSEVTNKVDEMNSAHNETFLVYGKGSYRKIKIPGPTPLKGTTMDIISYSSGATMLLAAMSAEGKSVVRGFDLIERNHENFLEKLLSLGARISK